MLRNVACHKPVVLCMQRILCGSVKDDVEAGVRFDFYAHRKGLELAIVPHRIIDTAFVSPIALSSCLHDQMTDFAEAAAQWRCVVQRDLDYDIMLSRLIRANELAANRLLWNARSRLVMDKFHLRRMIKQRMDVVENLWPLKSVDSDTDLYSDNTQRIATLIHQMVTKELPYAITDSTKKLPSCATFNYERPTIAMKTARGSPSGGTTKKRKAVSKATAKIPPRPILPAVRSRTPSSESINTEQSEVVVGDLPCPLTVCGDENTICEPEKTNICDLKTTTICERETTNICKLATTIIREPETTNICEPETTPICESETKTICKLETTNICELENVSTQTIL